MPWNDHSLLSAYLEAFEDAPLVLNEGLVAGENLRGLGATEPLTWFSLEKAREAIRTKRDLTLQDVSGGRVIALGTAQTVAGKKYAPGDQVFYLPATKTVQSVKTYKALQAESSPVTPTQATSTPSGAQVVSVADVQALVVRLGTPRTGAIGDGRFGPSTVAAYRAQAAKRAPRMDARIERVDAKTARVDSATWAALNAAAGAASKPKPKPQPPKPSPTPRPLPAAKRKPTDPRRGGMLQADVGQLQDILIRLQMKVRRDGDFGPKTVAAWTTAAKRRKLDGAIDRAGPTAAWVDPKTFDALATAAGVKGAKPQGQPISAQTGPAKDAAPSPGGATLTALEPITAAQLQTIFRAFGKSPKKAPEIQAAWADIAKANRLNATSQISKLGLEVVPATRDALVQKAVVRLEAAQLVAASVAPLSVKTLQEAMKFANQTDAYKGRLSGVAITGSWDGRTEDAFFVFYNIAAVNIPAWELAFKSIVSKNKSLVRVPPQLATSAEAAAKNYAKLGKIVRTKEREQKKAAAVAVLEGKQLEAEVARAVALATTLTPVFAVQQALSEVRELQKAGKLPGPVLQGIALTGRWDAATDKGLFATFSDEMWGADVIPKGAWTKLLTRVLTKSAKTKAGLTGLYGVFGDLAAAPTGATHIRLPASTARKIQNLAADFVARSAKAGAMTESKEDVTIPVPAGGGRVAGPPIFISGRAPAPAPSPTPFVTGEQMQVPSIETPDGARVDVPVAPTPAPAAETSAPAPAPSPLAPVDAEGAKTETPSTDAKTGKGEWILAILASGGAIYLLARGEKEHRNRQRAKALSSRQTNRRRR